MELTPLRYFREIARFGHMTRAAESLGVTQPALSAMLRKLETEIGAELLTRTGRGVELTEAGREFLGAAEEALRRLDAGVRSVRELIGLEHGSIRVGGGATAITYLLPRVASEFRAQHPGLRFYVREAGSRAVIDAVLQRDAEALDLGIVTLPADGPAALPRAQDLRIAPWVEDELRLIVPAGHRLDQRPAFRWRDLDSQPLIAFEAGSAVRELMEHQAASHGVRLNVVMELRSIESIKSMVGAGIGVGLVSRFALPDGEGARCKDGPLSRRLAIIRRGDKVPSPAAGALERALVDAHKPRKSKA